MKYLLSGLLMSALIISAEAQAARPCKIIAEACLSAGVFQSGASREVMLENCVKPIVSGRNIAGVNIDSATIQACKAKIAEQG